MPTPRSPVASPPFRQALLVITSGIKEIRSYLHKTRSSALIQNRRDLSGRGDKGARLIALIAYSRENSRRDASFRRSRRDFRAFRDSWRTDRETGENPPRARDALARISREFDEPLPPPPPTIRPTSLRSLRDSRARVFAGRARAGSVFGSYRRFRQLHFSSHANTDATGGFLTCRCYVCAATKPPPSGLFFPSPVASRYGRYFLFSARVNLLPFRSLLCSSVNARVAIEKFPRS